MEQRPWECRTVIPVNGIIHPIGETAWNVMAKTKQLLDTVDRETGETAPTEMSTASSVVKSTSSKHGTLHSIENIFFFIKIKKQAR